MCVPVLGWQGEIRPKREAGVEISGLELIIYLV